MPEIVTTNRAIWNALAITTPDDTPPLVIVSRFDVPMPISNNLRRCLRKAREEFGTVAELRDVIVAKYAKRDEHGVVITLDEGRQTALDDPDGFLKELDALMDQPVTLSDVRAVTIAELGDGKISPEKLDLLIGSFVTDG